MAKRLHVSSAVKSQDAYSDSSSKVLKLLEASRAENSYSVVALLKLLPDIPSVSKQVYSRIKSNKRVLNSLCANQQGIESRPMPVSLLRSECAIASIRRFSSVVSSSSDSLLRL